MYVLASRKGRSKLSFPASRLRGNDKGDDNFLYFLSQYVKILVISQKALAKSLITRAKTNGLWLTV